MTDRVLDNSGRRQAILEVLARELERQPGHRITTAALARSVGVSEAALYRHFPSKARMFEALIAFAEESVFGLHARILAGEPQCRERCGRMLEVLLGFGERNPGISRILVGDALIGEHERLRIRVAQFFDRVETQLRQVLREGLLAPPPRPDRDVAAGAGLLLACVDGRLASFVRSGFRDLPTAHWPARWAMLSAALFPEPSGKLTSST